MRVLVLGAYGLIGAQGFRHMRAAGHTVTGAGRDIISAMRRMPHVRWRNVDIVNMRRPEHWTNLLADQDAVVNCAGALQDSARDNVTAVQETAMRALFDACVEARVKTVVQISAVGASPRSPTRFMRTKAMADAYLASLALEWTILRPGLVIGPAAYGATALLRALAAFPLVIPVLGGSQKVQTIHADDVAKASVAAIEGRVRRRNTYDLVEAEAYSLEEILIAFRAWLALPPAPIVHVPEFLGAPLLKIGDGLRWLGWRAPLCSTAFAEINAGVVGDPGAWRAATGADPATSLSQTLARIPSTVQERWFARAWLLKPVIVGTLSLFWMLSGLIALIRLDAAVAVLTDHGIARPLASAIALTGGVVDIVLGGALLIRGLCARAAQATITLSLVYLAGATLLAPDLWADPLGPLVKVIPVIVLTLVLLGTGAGIAFFMVIAHRTGDARLIAHVASTVVLADFVFTATSVIVQPITGIALVLKTGRSLLEGWIALSLALYLIAGAFWLPVVFLQMRLRDLARHAAAENKPLPALYHRLYTVWYAFGFPAFTSVLAILWLMSAKPELPMPWDH